MGAEIIGEAVAGESAKTLAQLQAAIKQISSSGFDVMELLYKVKKNNFYVAYGFTTMQEFYESLDVKARRSQYLLRVAEQMEILGVQRAQYEPVGISKLRELSRLKLTEDPIMDGTPSEFVLDVIAAPETFSLDDIAQTVRCFKGETGENEKTWLNIPFTRLVMDKTIRPAIDKMKAELGTTAKTEEGLAVDASDSYSVEMIMADKLAEGEVQ